MFDELDKDKKGALDEKQLAEGINRVVMAQAFVRGPRFAPGGYRLFEDDLLKDIIPYVESHYSVKEGAAARAIAGLSMGGGQALTIGLKHPDQFAWVGGFSSVLFGSQADLITADTAKQLRFLWVSCGDKDRLVDASKSFHEALDEKNVPHLWHIDAGEHNWPVWQNDLYLLARMLFKDKQ